MKRKTTQLSLLNCRSIHNRQFVPMRPSSGIPTTRVAGEPAARWIWSKATRRATRRAAALADELNVHSFRVHIDGTVTWTRMHEKLAQAKPRGKAKPAQGKETSSTKREQSERQKRSNERAAAHNALMEKAQAFRAKAIFKWWASVSAHSSPAVEAAHPPMPLLPAQSQSDPLTTPTVWLSATAPVQPERMDDERASKRRPPSSPVAATPTAPRAKQRVDSPSEQGLNPNATAFLPNPSASSGRSAQPIGEAAFTRTFSRPASSSSTSASPRSHRWGVPGSTTEMALLMGSNESG